MTEGHIVDTLIILGNGYDLNCGLKSHFSDFFESKFLDSVKRYVDDFYLGAVPGFNNIWYLLLYLNFYTNYFGQHNFKEIKWMNVEDFIRYIITVPYKGGGSFCGRIQMFIDKAHINIAGKDVVDNFINKTCANEKDAVSLLKKHLHDLENDFTEYLNSQLTNNVRYNHRAKYVVDELLDGQENEATVINFNYTKINRRNPKIALEYNIHGSLLERNIIIGLDAEFADPTKSGVVFSKAWRKLFAKNSFEYELSDKEKIKTIKFYGHSLSVQDYSYFMTIFNYYDIQNKTELIFYYTPYKDSEKENLEILEEYTKAIYALIEKYGKEVFGESEGKNLLTRLLLQNRINIQEIERFDKLLTSN